jgi:heme A synthase
MSRPGMPPAPTPSQPRRRSRRPGRSPVRRGWSAFTAVLMWAVFLQSVTAGRIFSGDDWARSAHRTAAGLLFLAALAAGLVAAVQLRGRPQRRRMAALLLGLAVVLFLQHGLGTAAAEGSEVLWLHVPLGVALVGFSMQPNRLAHQLA